MDVSTHLLIDSKAACGLTAEMASVAVQVECIGISGKIAHAERGACPL